MFSEVLEYYLPGAQITLPGGPMTGSYDGHSQISEMIETAVKEYGRPRVRIESIHEVDNTVFVETLSTMDGAVNSPIESHNFHVFDFEGDKVRRHRVFTDAAVAPHPAPPR